MALMRARQCGLNSTFSTNRLYRGFKKYTVIKKL